MVKGKALPLLLREESGKLQLQMDRTTFTKDMAVELHSSALTLEGAGTKIVLNNASI